MLTRFTRSFAFACALLPATVSMGFSQSDLGRGFAGAYLAARTASVDGDHRNAAAFFERALAADPGNGFLIGNAIFSRAALGEWRRAAEIAGDSTPEGPGRELANLARMVDGLSNGDLVGARAAIEAGNGAGPFIDDLALAWIAFGDGNMSAAVAQFEEVAQGALADIAYTHLGFARAAVGDFEGAEAILSGETYGRVSMTDRTVRARALILHQLDQRDAALELLSSFLRAIPDPSLLALRDRIAQSDAPGPYDFVTTAQEGLAELFYNVSRAVGQDGGSNTLPLLYAQAARGIDPNHSASLMYAGSLFDDEQRYDLAAETYAQVPEGDDLYVEAQLGRANSVFDSGDQDAAVAVMADLAQARPDLSSVQAALGDMLRRSDQCAPAIDAYTDALNLIDTTQESAWFVFYTRAICYERVDDWPPAEADFRRALELNQGQPGVLNYLGYSLVEQRRNLDEALDMIERAVAARPDSGYITDSLGWVLYRLGRFDEAVEPMERAVALEPNDPIINDHLGDVYWMVGRYREAEFQWHRALSFEPEDVDAERIRQKLEVGLYDVLEAEGGVGATQ